MKNTAVRLAFNNSWIWGSLKASRTAVFFIDDNHCGPAGLQQLLDLGEFALFYLRREPVVAGLPNSMGFIGDHDVNYVHIRAHVAIEVTDLSRPTGANDLADS